MTSQKILKKLAGVISIIMPIFLFSINQVELITTFESENEMGVTIKTSNPIDFDENVSQSPPILTLLFPYAELTQDNYSKQISLPPLYKIEAKNVGTSKLSTEVTLFFTILPEYHIETEGGLITRITWAPQKDAIERRKKARRLTTFDTTVSLHFKEAEIIDILRLLQAQNNLNIIAGEAVEGKVTVSLDDVNMGTALDAILKVNGYDWFMQENIVVIKPIDEDMSGELETKLYKLEYIDASALASALINVLTDKGKVSLFSPVAKGGGTGIGGGSSAQGAGGGGLLGALSGGGGGVTPTSGTSQTSTAAGGAGGGGSAAGVTSMDHLLVTDVHSNFDRIEEIILKLDKPIPQINIAVKFIETTLSLDEQMGINWDMRASLSGPTASDATSTSAGIDIGWAGKDLRLATLSLPTFTALFNILSSDNNTRIVQEPQTTTQDNTTATLTSGTTYPIMVPTGEGSAFGSSPVTFEDQEINVSLTITPRINEGRFVTMNINTSVDALVGFSGPDDDRPIVSSRSSTTQVSVPNGETLLMGGLIFDQRIETITSIPILSKIPLIKKLFIDKSTKNEQRELLIFITPNIVNLN